MGDYQGIQDELLKRLQAAPGRVQILSGPRQVGKTTLLMEMAKEFGEQATYVSADSTEAQMSGWWEQVVRAAGERSLKIGVCNEGDETPGRDGGVRTQSWASFLLNGPNKE